MTGYQRDREKDKENEMTYIFLNADLLFIYPSISASIKVLIFACDIHFLPVENCPIFINQPVFSNILILHDDANVRERVCLLPKSLLYMYK